MRAVTGRCDGAQRRAVLLWGVDGRHPIWWLGGGRERTLERSGTRIQVFTGDTVNIVVTAANCQAALQRRGCPAFFDLGGGNDLLYRYSMGVSGRH
jgi:hypothetical protein